MYLPQGACRVSVTDFGVSGVTMRRVLWFEGVLDLLPGGAQDLKLDTGTATRMLRIFEADGHPVRRGWFEVSQWGAVRTGPDGEVELYALPSPPAGVVLQTRPAPGQPVRKVVLSPYVKVVRLPAR